MSELWTARRSTGITTGGQHLSDREAIDVTIDILDALIAIHPDAVRIEVLRKKSEGQASTMASLTNCNASRTRVSSIAMSSPRM